MICWHFADFHPYVAMFYLCVSSHLSVLTNHINPNLVVLVAERGTSSKTLDLRMLNHIASSKMSLSLYCWFCSSTDLQNVYFLYPFRTLTLFECCYELC